MKTYDEMVNAALSGYGNPDIDRVAAGTVILATKDGLKSVTAVVDLDYHPKPVMNVPDRDLASNGENAFITIRARTACGKMFRTYKTRAVDFTWWMWHGKCHRRDETASWTLAMYADDAARNDVIADYPSEREEEMALSYIYRTEVDNVL